MQRTASIVLITSLLVLSACERSGPEQTVVAAKPKLQTEIRWTAFGIPHVKADNWAGLGYGFAYATARDGVCVLARELVRVDGEMTRYFADGENNLPSDIFHKALLTPQRLTEYASGESSKSNAFAGGYVAGYNRYLRDHQGSLPADCNGASWLRPMVAADVAGLALSVSTRYGLGRMVAEIAAAKPPRSSSEEGVNLQTDFDVTQGDGSNAVALGRAVTASGRGILFGNPHYPWEGPARFHMLHATIPGELDVMGVSLLVTPRVVIGFNKDVAWSHTVSTALRSTFYELELNPDNAMQYRYGEGFRDIEAVVVKVNETNAHGDIMSGQHTLYFSHFGPLVVSKALPWTSSKAYALRDSNLENTHTSADRKSVV